MQKWVCVCSDYQHSVYIYFSSSKWFLIQLQYTTSFILSQSKPIVFNGICIIVQ